MNCSSPVPHPNFLRPESYSSAAKFSHIVSFQSQIDIQRGLIHKQNEYLHSCVCLPYYFAFLDNIILKWKISKRYFKVKTNKYIPYMGYKLCSTILCAKSLKFPPSQKSVYLEIGVLIGVFCHICSISTIQRRQLLYKNNQFWNFFGGLSRPYSPSNSREIVCCVPSGVVFLDTSHRFTYHLSDIQNKEI